MKYLVIAEENHLPIEYKIEYETPDKTLAIVSLPDNTKDERAISKKELDAILGTRTFIQK